MTSEQDPIADIHVRHRRLLAYLGSALMAGGQPSHETEAEVRRVARFLGYPDCQVGALPTGIDVALASGEPSTFEAIRSSLTLDQSAGVHEIRTALVNGTMDPDQAAMELATLPSRPPRYGNWGFWVGGPMVGIGLCAIMQPGLVNILFAAIANVFVLVLIKLGGRHPIVKTLLPSLAGFGVALFIFGAAMAGWLVGPLRTILPPLAIPLPGGLLVTGMAELAAGAAVAGSSRLVQGIVSLMMFTLGVVSAALVLNVPPELYANVRVEPFFPLALLLGFLVISAGIMLVENVPLKLWPWTSGVLLLTFVFQVLGQTLGNGSAALGCFLGAMAASAGASIVESVRPQLPRLVVFLPSFWLLVPGTLGVLTVTQLGVEPERAVLNIIGVVAVVCAIVLGLLVGSAVASALRRARQAAVRRARSRRAPV